MSNLVRFSDMFYVGDSLDSDGELEISIPECWFEIDSECRAFFVRHEILDLITHLSKVLDDADKEQETER